MEYEVFNEKIFYFKNAIPNSKEIIDYINKTSNNVITDWLPWGNQYAFSLEQERDWKKEGIVSPDFGSAKCIYNIIDNVADRDKVYTDSYWVFKSIDDAVNKCSEIYADLMKIDTKHNPKLSSGGYVIGRYNAMSSRGPHTDCPYDDLEHSYVIYYNDDYEGGELKFVKHNLTIKPEAGSIIMFKSSDLENEHEALYPKGYKYITPHFWRMGPSQGFIPYGTKIEDSTKNITHDFLNLKNVEEKRKESKFKKQYLEENIFYIEDFVSPEDIKIIVEEVNKVPKSAAYEHAIHQIYEVPSICDLWQKYNSKLLDLLNNETQFYRSCGSPPIIVYGDEKNLGSPRNPNGEWIMQPHSDNTEDTYIDHDGVIANVAQGIVIFITDDFSGGEIKYTNKNIIFKPKSGTLLCHPGSKEYEHGVLRFSGGRRIVFTGFTYKKEDIVEHQNI